MQTFLYKVKTEDGLHARPAGLLVKHAQAMSSHINILVNGKCGNAKRLFAVMGLNVKQNDEIMFEIDGPAEEADCKSMKEFCESNI